jgi:putative oxidoreductase
MFPNARPGAGLLLLRLTLGGGLIANAAVAFPQSVPSQLILAVAEVLTGVFLIIGLWTPVTGAIVVSLAIGTVLLAGPAEPQLLRAAIGLSLVFVGPGAYSIDARRFGRRRVEIKQPRDD